MATRIHNGEKYVEYEFPMFRKMNENCMVLFLDKKTVINIRSEGSFKIIGYNNELQPPNMMMMIKQTEPASAEEFKILFNQINKLIVNHVNR